jgi:hypothetical protein
MYNWFAYGIASLFCVKTEDNYILVPSLSRVSFWLILFRILYSPEIFNGTWLALLTVVMSYIFAVKIVDNKETARKENCE